MDILSDAPSPVPPSYLPLASCSVAMGYSHSYVRKNIRGRQLFLQGKKFLFCTTVFPGSEPQGGCKILTSKRGEGDRIFSLQLQEKRKLSHFELFSYFT